MTIPPTVDLLLGILTFALFGAAFWQTEALKLRALSMSALGVLALHLLLRGSPMAAVGAVVLVLVNATRFSKGPIETPDLVLSERDELVYQTSFQTVTRAQYKELTSTATWMAADPGVVLVEAGEMLRTLMLITRGSADVLLKKKVVSDVKAGLFLGETNFFEGAPAPTTVRAKTPVQYLSWDIAKLQAFLANRPELSQAMRGILGLDLSKKARRSVGLATVIGTQSFEEIQESSKKVRDEMLFKAEREIEKHRSIAEMVTGVAHEINTPIGIVNTAASCISEALSPKGIEELAKDEDAVEELEDLREAADLIQTHIARASKLVQNFKNLSANQITEARGTGDIEELVTEIVQLFGMQAVNQGIEVRVQVDLEPGDREWVGYPGYLSQILMNLLQNIRRYGYPAPEAGVVTIELGLGERPEFFRMVVRDEGAGIEPEALSRVFDAFFTTGRDRGGTGLGMAIVHNLVTEVLGGTIDVTSEVGAGTAVAVEIPRVVEEVR